MIGNNHDGSSHEAPFVFFEYHGTQLKLSAYLKHLHVRIDDGYVVRRGSMNVPNFSREVIGYIFTDRSGTEHLAVNQLLAQDMFDQLAEDRLFREIEAVYEVFFYAAEPTFDERGKVVTSVNRKLKDTLESWGYSIEMVGISLLYQDTTSFHTETLRRASRKLVGYIIYDDEEPAIYIDAIMFLELVQRLCFDQNFVKLLKERKGEYEPDVDAEPITVLEKQDLLSYDSEDPDTIRPAIIHSQDPEVFSEDTVILPADDEEPTEDCEEEPLDQTEQDLLSPHESTEDAPF